LRNGRCDRDRGKRATCFRVAAWRTVIMLSIMNRAFAPALLALILPIVAAGAGGVPSLLARVSPEQQLAQVVNQVRAKLGAGAQSEAELAEEIARLDALFAEHKGGPPELVADILMVKVQLYVDVMEEPEKGAEVFRKFKAEFPASPLAKEVDAAIRQIELQAEQTKVARALKPGIPFPAFVAGLKDTTGQPFTLDRHKGKVVLIDFWATWCAPCIDELPGLVAAYNRHHAAGFEILGISLDREGDLGKLTALAKEHKMPWPQFYDGKHMENVLAVQYGVRVIPATYLLDRDGRIIGKNLRGAALERAVAEALKK
jgi:peroxiredoxin